jgi:UDP-N-acetylglucosamine 2-epimerase
LFIHITATDAEMEQLKKQISQEKGIAHIKFINREQAAERYKSETGQDIYQILEYNPLPASFIITPSSDYQRSDKVEILKKRLENFGLITPKGVKLIEPVGYLDFLQLEANAKIILTDSGGVQEEACIHNVPCVVLRDYSDRPETINIGAAKLAGTDPDKILEATKYLISANKSWENPFGDGYSGMRIIELLKQELN